MLIHRATGSIAGGAVATALLMLNPDVLYLQSTPMTEPLLFGTTFAAVALIGRWSVPPSRAASAERFGETAPAQRSSAGAGCACIAAVLTRYEAFPIVATAIGLAFLVLLRRGLPVGEAFRKVRGLALYPLWALAAFLVNSKVSVGAFFVSGGFFVAENPALGDPWMAWTQLWESLARLTGPVLPWIAAAAAAWLVVAAFLPPEGRSHVRGVASAFRRKSAKPEVNGEAVSAFRRKSANPEVIMPLALAACAALPLYAYYQGHPVRVRYAVPLVAAAAAITGTAVGLLPRRAQAAAGLAVVTLAAWQAPPFFERTAVVAESQRDASNFEGRRAVTAYLERHWDGQPILMSMGSLSHYMHDLSRSGFHIRDFLHEGNGEIWKYVVQHPHPVVEWIAIEEKAEGGDALFWQATHDATFLRGFQRVAEGGGVALYRRR